MPRRSSPPYMLLSSLDHPGRGLYRLAAHMRRRARRPGIALSAALSRATKPAAAYRRGLKRRRPLRRARLIAYAPDHYGHLQQERESVHHERAATATLRVSSAECQPYPDQTTSDTVNSIGFLQLSYFL